MIHGGAKRRRSDFKGAFLLGRKVSLGEWHVGGWQYVPTLDRKTVPFDDALSGRVANCRPSLASLRPRRNHQKSTRHRIEAIPSGLTFGAIIQQIFTCAIKKCSFRKYVPLFVSI